MRTTLFRFSVRIDAAIGSAERYGARMVTVFLPCCREHKACCCCCYYQKRLSSMMLSGCRSLKTLLARFASSAFPRRCYSHVICLHLSPLPVPLLCSISSIVGCCCHFPALRSASASFTLLGLSSAPPLASVLPQSFFCPASPASERLYSCSLSSFALRMHCLCLA